MRGRFFGRHLDGAADLFAGLVEPAHLDQQVAQVQQRVGVAGVLPQAGEVVPAGLFQLALGPEGLGDADVDVGVAARPGRASCCQQ